MGNRSSYAYGTSQYLRAADVAGKRFDVVVTAVEDVEFDNDGRKGIKPVLSLEGLPKDLEGKKLVVNATNFDTLADAFGGFTESWVGKRIVLVGEKITVKGKRTDSIRVRISAESPMPATPAAAGPDLPDDALPL